MATRKQKLRADAAGTSLNPVAKAVYGSRYHHAHNQAGLQKLMRGRYPSGGGSFWFTLNQG